MTGNSQTSVGQTTHEESRVSVWDVFVSYAMEDAAWVKVLVDHLKTLKLNVFDPYAAPAEFWGRSREEILNTILPAQCRAVLVVLSAAYSGSAYGSSELLAFTKATGTRNGALLLPVRLDESPVPDAMRFVATLDVRTNSPEQVAEKVVATLRERMQPNKVDATSTLGEGDRWWSQSVLEELQKQFPSIVSRIHRSFPQLDAEDVANRAMYQVLKNWNHESPIERNSRYFHVVAQRIAIDDMRRNLQLPKLVNDGRPLLDSIESPSSYSVDQDMIDEVRRAIDKLSSPEKQVVQMHYLEGMTRWETAEQLGLSRRTLEKLLRSTQVKLRDLIKAEV